MMAFVSYTSHCWLFTVNVFSILSITACQYSLMRSFCMSSLSLSWWKLMVVLFPDGIILTCNDDVFCQFLFRHVRRMWECCVIRLTIPSVPSFVLYATFNSRFWLPTSPSQFARPLLETIKSHTTLKGKSIVFLTPISQAACFVRPTGLCVFICFVCIICWYKIKSGRWQPYGSRFLKAKFLFQENNKVINPRNE